MKFLANTLSAFNDVSSGPYFSECGLYVFCNAQWIYFHQLQSFLVNFSIYHILWQGVSQVIYLLWEEQNETALASGKLWCQPTGCQCCHVLCW